MITQNVESSRDLLLSVTNRKALAPGGHSPQKAPLRNIYYITTSHFLTTRSAIGCWLRKEVSTLIGYLLTDGLNYLTQIFSRLAFGIKGCSSKTRFISSIVRLLCPALWHYVREHIIYTVYLDCVLVFAFAFLSCKTKSALNRTFSTESYRNWRKSVEILKNNGLFLKNKQKF